eukprot:1133438-Pelagomonas_calceolata.AAC.2
MEACLCRPSAAAAHRVSVSSGQDRQDSGHRAESQRCKGACTFTAMSKGVQGTGLLGYAPEQS